MVKTWTEIGEEQGQLKERLRMVHQLLEAKFQTTLTEGIQQRLATRNPEELNQLSLKLLTANSLKELGLEN